MSAQVELNEVDQHLTSSPASRFARSELEGRGFLLR